jgi:membrane-bound lytic murein transglycosylase B
MTVLVVSGAVGIAAVLLFGVAAFAMHATRTVVVPTSQLSVVPSAPAAKVLAPTTGRLRASRAWVTSTSRATGIGAVAVSAYGTVSLRLARDRPGCHLGWTTLAGIGGVESGHGTTGGATLLADGSTSKPILGPALNGTAGMASIRSNAQSSHWHGDPRWDHAVGPMQFIPSTWRTWGADGNGDGVSDPNNMYDAAYATGLYLCASGADLRTGQGWSRAIFSYNHSDDYVRSVLVRANSYAG